MKKLLISITLIFGTFMTANDKFFVLMSWKTTPKRNMAING